MGLDSKSSPLLPFHFQYSFLRLFQNEINIKYFENWLYDTSELEDLLKGSYYDLLALDFEDVKVLDEIKTIIDPFLDYSELEKREVLRLLNKAVRLDDDFPEILKIIYDLGVASAVLHDLERSTYGLTFEKGIYYDMEWCTYNESKRRELVGSFYESIVKEAEEVKNKLIQNPMDGRLLKEGCFPNIPK